MPLPTTLSDPPARALDLELVSGEWPAGLDGEVYVSFPWPLPGVGKLFGWGALGRLSLSPATHGAPRDRWAWRCGIIDSPSHRIHDTLPEEFQAGPTGLSSAALGFPNMVNTAPLPWGQRLFATWDVGRPIEVDPDDFRFLSTVGDTESWGEPSPGPPGLMPFYFSTAHPVIDPERQQMWTVKLTPSSTKGATGEMGSQLNLIRWTGTGSKVDQWPLPDTVVFGSAHTVSQTRHWIILADSGNYKTDLGEILGGERTARIDERASVYLISKAEAERTPPGTPLRVVPFTIGPTFGHFYARWDDADGVQILFEHLDGVDLADSLHEDDVDAAGAPVRADLVGLYNMAMAPSSVSEWVLDPDARTPAGATERRGVFEGPEWAWNLQLSAMDWSLAGLLQPDLHHMVFQGRRPGAVSRRTLDRYAGRFDMPPGETPPQLVSLTRGSLEVHARYEFSDDDVLVSSPTFVRRGRPGGREGVVVVAVLCDRGFRFEVFDATAVDAGPVATLAPGEAGDECTTLPLLLHSAWSPHPAEPRGVGETGPAFLNPLEVPGEFDAAAVQALPEDLRAALAGQSTPAEQQTGRTAGYVTPTL